MLGQHFTQYPVYFMAGISRRQHRLRAGNMFTHTRKVAEITVAKRMVQQLAALLCAGTGSADDMQDRYMLSVAPGNAVERAQFTDAIGGQQRARALNARIAIGGIGGV